VFVGLDRHPTFERPPEPARFLTGSDGEQLTISAAVVRGVSVILIGSHERADRRGPGVTPANGGLGHRLSALRADFAALGSRAAGAADGLVATLPPPTMLLDELSAARKAFTELRAAMLEQAGALSVILEEGEIGTLRDLEPVLAAITAAEEHRAHVAAWEEAREEAFSVLDRVVALVHREDKSLPALNDAQARARELRMALAGAPPAELAQETTALPTRTRPYADLLALIEGWNVLDDDRCAALQDAVTESFSRALGLAALRGRLGRHGEAPPASRKRARPSAPPEPEPVSATPAPSAPVVAIVPEPVVVQAPTPQVADAPMQVAPLVAPTSPPPPLAPAAAAPAAGPPDAGVVEILRTVDPVTAATTGSFVGGLRQSGDAPAIDEASRAREDELERLAQETAQWWIGARTGWQGLRERGLGFGDAAFDFVKRFPYLLSVPLQKSAEYEGGRLAEGYALLLAHIDKQEEGFVQQALTRLNPLFTTPDALSRELYLYVVAEGRLYKTYPDFVRDVVASVIPRPGAWVQGGIVEADEGTRLFMRAEKPGSTEEQTRTLTESKERLGPHVFRVSLGPLTTRFFTLRLAGETLADPPNVEIKLTENEAPTDHAWLVTLPAAGKAQAAPRKHRTGGTTLEEFGQEFSGFWMGIFNADPKNDRRYELSIMLRRKPPPLPPDPKPGAKPASDRFFGKTR
jgi:hypothetical protein